ncbi:MAG: YbaY family lipoprotein [Vulcanimicrobiaceae bacterium]
MNIHSIVRSGSACALGLAAVLAAPAARAATMHHVTGTVSYRAHTALDPQARVWVSLQDVSLADAPAKLVANTLVKGGGALPLPFDIAYDPDGIVASHRYVVRSTIIVDGVTRYVTDASYPVITHGSPSVVHLTLVPAHEPATTHVVAPPASAPPMPMQPPAAPPAAAPSPGAPQPTLTSTAWGLTSVNGKAFAGTADNQPYLQFDAADKHLSGFSGCNRLAGGYQTDGTSTLHLGQVASTMMMCEPGVENQPFVAALSTITSYAITGTTLTLYANGTPAITLEPKMVPSH